MIIPPIKSQGIKTKLVPIILDNIQFDNKGYWIEPFAGTCVVGFNLKPKNAIFSDTNIHIINFYNALKRNKINAQIVKEYLENEGYNLSVKGEEYYYELRDRFNKDFTELDFLFLNRAGFNGMIRFNKKGGYNIPFCKKNERFSKAYITKIVNQVKNVKELIDNNNWEFSSQDYETTINLANNEDFVYCDPPYIDRYVDYYNSWSEQDENKLFNLLTNLRCKFILSTWYNNEFRKNVYIEKLWNKFNIIFKEHFYHVGGFERNRNKMIEALVLNYLPHASEESISSVNQLELSY